MSASNKLEQLRDKTDRQLAALIGREIDRGLDLAREEGRRPRAERAYAEAHRLLPTVYDTDQRVRLQFRLDELRDALGFTAMRRAAGG
jgi:hypothetical protein